MLLETLEDDVAILRELRECSLRETAFVTRIRPDHVKSRRQARYGESAALHQRHVALVGGHRQLKFAQRFLNRRPPHKKQIIETPKRTPSKMLDCA